jgi:hypothetical protein
MEIAKQIIENGNDSAYLREQAETLTEICSKLFSIDRLRHMAHFQRHSMLLATQVIEAMAEHHRNAIKEVEAHEKEQRLFSEKAKDLLKAKTASLNTAGKMALVEFARKYHIQSNQLAMKDAEAYLVGEQLDEVNSKFAQDAILYSKRSNLVINTAIDELWDCFEQKRPSIEKKLSRKIRAYEKQLTVAAEAAKLAISRAQPRLKTSFLKSKG